MGINELPLVNFGRWLFRWGRWTGPRMALDYRDLNAIRDKFRMPRIHHIKLTLAKSKIFSKLDLKKGYYQIPMSPESKQYTALAFNNKLHQFQYAPLRKLGIHRSVYTFLVSGSADAPETYGPDNREVGLHRVEYYLDDMICIVRQERAQKSFRASSSCSARGEFRTQYGQCQIGRKVFHPSWGKV